MLMQRLCLDIHVLNDFCFVEPFFQKANMQNMLTIIFITYIFRIYVTSLQVKYILTFLFLFKKRVFCLFDNTTMLIYSNCKYIKFKHHIYALSCIQMYIYNYINIYVCHKCFQHLKDKYMYYYKINSIKISFETIILVLNDSKYCYA